MRHFWLAFAVAARRVRRLARADSSNTLKGEGTMCKVVVAYVAIVILCVFLLVASAQAGSVWINDYWDSKGVYVPGHFASEPDRDSTPTVSGLQSYLDNDLKPDNKYSQDSTYLGKFSSNPYDSESISNPYGRYGNPYGNTITNPYSSYGSTYSTHSWKNPYTTDAPKIYAQDGTYLGKLSSNPYDSESISNPYGRYGSPYSNGLMNPYSAYGSPYSSQSWRNPYTISSPRIYSFGK